MGSVQLAYDGYDPQWVLGRDKGPPVETKPKPPPAPAPVAKKEPAGPVELKVPLCCEGCEKNVSERLLNVEGVESVRVDMEAKKVVVTGKVKPDECLKVVKKIQPRSEFWPKKPEKKDEGKKEDAKKDDAKKDDGKKKPDNPQQPKKEEKKEVKKDDKKDDKKEEKKEGPPPPVEITANICCEGCVQRLYAAIKDIDDVTDVKINQSTGKITVTGKAKVDKIMNVTKKIKPAAKLVEAKKK